MENSNIFVDLLSEELKKRKKQNLAYSLRNFAKDLGIQPGVLSKILNKRTTLTEKMISRLGVKLGLSISQIQKQMSSQNCEINKKNKNTKMHALNNSKIQILSQWYFFPILEMFNLKNVIVNVDSVAKMLGLNKRIANNALLSLEDLGFIKKEGDFLKPIQIKNTTLSFSGTTDSLRELQKQILKKAIVAIDEISVDKRNQTTLTFAFPKEELPYLVGEITKFRRKINRKAELFEKSCDEVYNLSFSLYPLTMQNED